MSDQLKPITTSTITWYPEGECFGPSLAGKEGKYDDLDNYLYRCNQLLQMHLQISGRDTQQEIGLKDICTPKTDLQEADRLYSLLYASDANDFFCRGWVDLQENLLHFEFGTSEGFYELPEEISDEIPLEIPLFQARTMSEGLLGKEMARYKCFGRCTDFTLKDRNWQAGIDISTAMFLFTDFSLSAINVVRNGLRFALKQPRVWKLFPLTNFFWKGVRSGVQHSWRLTTQQLPRALNGAANLAKTYGPQIASGVANTMLPLGLKTFTTGVGSLGLGAAAGWGTIALGAGIGIGIGINHLPRLWGGRKISDSGGDWLFGTFGSLPEWML